MNDIKITSGEYRGRSIRTPGGGTHPMGARERLALLNMLGAYLPGARVLDAYAGSGALGIEALSRGASYVTFVEKSPRASRTIRENLDTLGIADNYDIFQQDTKSFSVTDSYDIILVDPPYGDFELNGVKNLVKLLKPAGILVLSHPGDAPEIDGLELIKTHRYAAAHLSVYKQDGNNS